MNFNKKRVLTVTLCGRCGNKVTREEELKEEYPYYCPDCDENMYSIECLKAPQWWLLKRFHVKKQ